MNQSIVEFDLTSQPFIKTYLNNEECKLSQFLIRNNDSYYSRQCPSQCPISGTIKSIKHNGSTDLIEHCIITFTDDRICEIKRTHDDEYYIYTINDDLNGKNVIITLIETNIDGDNSYHVGVKNKDKIIAYITDDITDIDNLNVTFTLGG
jgi:hypothetical protein